ncbi:hypothetical protein SOVF_148730, partial [Spinacia oleracea]
MSSRSEKIGKPMVIRRGKKKKKKKTVVGRNSEDIPCIPEDIVVYEILSRLPTKSLVRFRSVCKLWNSVITHDTDFKSRHVEAEAVVGFPLNHLFLVHIQPPVPPPKKIALKPIKQSDSASTTTKPRNDALVAQ